LNTVSVSITEQISRWFIDSDGECRTLPSRRVGLPLARLAFCVAGSKNLRFLVMTTLAQQFGENTLDEPVSETIMRDVRLVRSIESQSDCQTCYRGVSRFVRWLTISIFDCFKQVARRLALVVMPGISSVSGLHSATNCREILSTEKSDILTTFLLSAFAIA
jgi:hypothetical protein